MTSATVSQFNQLFPATATTYKLPKKKVQVKQKFKNYWNEYTLTKLFTFFGVSGSHLHLYKVEDGCITVTWLCCTSVVKELKMAISDTADSFQSMGVLQVFVEEEIVFDCCKSCFSAKVKMINVWSLLSKIHTTSIERH